MRDVLEEYGYAIVVTIIICLLASMIVGPFFSAELKPYVVDALADKEVGAYLSQTAFNEYDYRNDPVFNTSGPIEIYVGDTIALTKYITAKNDDGADITKNIAFYKDGADLRGYFVGNEVGTFTITAKVVDVAPVVIDGETVNKHYGCTAVQNFTVYVLPKPEETTGT